MRGLRVVTVALVAVAPAVPALPAVAEDGSDDPEPGLRDLSDGDDDPARDPDGQADDADVSWDRLVLLLVRRLGARGPSLAPADAPERIVTYVRSDRQTVMHLQADWPYTGVLLAAFRRPRALPAPAG